MSEPRFFAVAMPAGLHVLDAEDPELVLRFRTLDAAEAAGRRLNLSHAVEQRRAERLRIKPSVQHQPTDDHEEE